MAKRIAWTEQAKSDVRTIEQSAALQILRTLGRYVKAEVGDVVQLRDVDPPLYRLRAQSHRIFFRHQGDQILIIRVLNRKEAYR